MSNKILPGLCLAFSRDPIRLEAFHSNFWVIAFFSPPAEESGEQFQWMKNVREKESECFRSDRFHESKWCSQWWWWWGRFQSQLKEEKERLICMSSFLLYLLTEVQSHETKIPEKWVLDVRLLFLSRGTLFHSLVLPSLSDWDATVIIT